MQRDIDLELLEHGGKWRALTSKLESVEASGVSSLKLKHMLVRKSKAKEAKLSLVVLVDPVTSGVKLAEEVKRAGFNSLYVFSRSDSPILNMEHTSKHVVPIDVMKFDSDLPEEEATELLKERIDKVASAKNLKPVAIIPAAETGKENYLLIF